MDIDPVKRREIDWFVRALQIVAAVALLAVVVAVCVAQETVIIKATWAECGGGVLPDQVEVPEPEPMP